MDWIANSITSLFGGSASTEDSGQQKTGILTKEQLSAFFEAGHKMFDDPTVKLRLKEAAAKKQNVDWVITEMQKQIFESQGIEGRFGIGFLGKIRTVYSNDAEIMQKLMQFVEREEMALDEAELTIDEFLKKLELKEWAMQQYQTMQQQIQHLTPQQQREFLHQQQLMMKEVSKESQEVIKASEDMSIEEKKKFIKEQVERIQARFQMKDNPVCNALSQGSDCQHCQQQSSGGPSLSQQQQRGPNLGSSMTAEEQTNFFKAMYNARR